MDESQSSGWAGLSGGSNPYASDNASLMSQQQSGNIQAGAAMGYSDPSIQGQMQQAPNYGGSVSPSSVNGYPVFSSSTAGVSSPSGYAGVNPIDATPSVIAQQARTGGPSPLPQNPSMPTAPTSNPWGIKNSSTPGAFDYPLGQNTPPPKLNVL